MQEHETMSLLAHFESLEDKRVERGKYHSLMDIIFLSVCGIIAGCDGPTDIEAFGKSQKGWLKRFIELPHGVPSHDTIGRVLAMVNPKQFRDCFLAWTKMLARELQLKRVAIDGKVLRRSHYRAKDQSPLHLVSAWSVDNHLTLGQVATDQKSNEITAIPELLKMLELRGAIVTIDAMGCQKEIAKQIVDGEGDYVLAVKDNQPTLAAALESYFMQLHEDDYQSSSCRCHVTREKSHGREEERFYCMAPVPESMRKFRKQWRGLKSIGQVITNTVREGKEVSDVRFYISSLCVGVKQFAESARGHWGIENSLHWVLDVTLHEDASRIRKGHGAENVGMLRRFAVTLFKRDSSNDSIRRKRKRAAWSTDFLESLVFQGN